MYLLRALIVWLIIICVETVHGILRTIFMVPLIGDLPARQISVVTGSILILLVALLTIRWMGEGNRSELLKIGILWVILTVLFEVGLGRLVMGLPWSRIAEDYNFLRGGFLGLGLLFMLIAPLLAAKIRNTESMHSY